MSTIAGGPLPVVARPAEPVANRPDASAQAVARVAAVIPADGVPWAMENMMPYPTPEGIRAPLAVLEARNRERLRRGKDGEAGRKGKQEHPDEELNAEGPGQLVNKDV